MNKWMDESHPEGWDRTVLKGALTKEPESVCLVPVVP